jgi:hypothetical protein
VSLEQENHDLYVRSVEARYWQIIREHLEGASRIETIAKLIDIGYSLEQAREEMNQREGENGNDNGC